MNKLSNIPSGIANDRLAVAPRQLPLSGGTAVYNARVLLRLYNDTLVFMNNCDSIAHENITQSKSEVVLQNNEIFKKDYFKAYPNPTQNSFVIEYELANKSDALIIIENIFGEQLLKQQLKDNSGKVIFDLNALSSGIYFYKITSNIHLLKVKKIIIQK